MINTIGATGNIGIGTTSPKHQVEITCKCGNTGAIDIPFDINIISIEFRCHLCRKVIAVPQPHPKKEEVGK